jgi:hypothetical protein
MLERSIFLELNQQYGPFELDAAADELGNNAQCNDWCSKTRSFMDIDCAGKRVWCNPPFQYADKFIEHYLKCKAKQPSRTAGCFMLPWRPQATWWPLLEGMQCVRTWEPGVQLFTMPALKPGGDRRRLRPCHMKIAVWFDPPAREHPPSDRECDQPAQPTAQGVDNLEQTGL